jgi:hypothetical protein
MSSMLTSGIKIPSGMVFGIEYQDVNALSQGRAGRGAASLELKTSQLLLTFHAGCSIRLRRTGVGDGMMMHTVNTCYNTFEE